MLSDFGYGAAFTMQTLAVAVTGAGGTVRRRRQQCLQCFLGRIAILQLCRYFQPTLLGGVDTLLQFIHRDRVLTHPATQDRDLLVLGVDPGA
jgi:hypothetical protein